MVKQEMLTTAQAIEIPFEKLGVPDIKQAIDQMWNKQIKTYPARSIYASVIGHPCERYLVYEQVAWQKKKKTPLRLQRIFGLGRRMGKEIMLDLQKALEPTDIEVVCQEEPIPENPQGIGGRIDGKLKVRRTDGTTLYVPVEVKGMSDFSWQKTNSVGDMLASDYVFTRSYPAQLTIYMYGNNVEWGLFILRNKTTNEDKPIWIHLDLAYAEELLDKAEGVQRYVQAIKSDPKAKLPDRIQWESNVCGQCPFLNECCPDLGELPGIEDRLGDNELSRLCILREQYEKEHKEFVKADESIKKHVKGIVSDKLVKKGDVQTILTKGFTITAKAGARKIYKVPDSIKEQYQEQMISITTMIEKA